MSDYLDGYEDGALPVPSQTASDYEQAKERTEATLQSILETLPPKGTIHTAARAGEIMATRALCDDIATVLNHCEALARERDQLRGRVVELEKNVKTMMWNCTNTTRAHGKTIKDRDRLREQVRVLREGVQCLINFGHDYRKEDEGLKDPDCEPWCAKCHGLKLFARADKVGTEADHE